MEATDTVGVPRQVPSPVAIDPDFAGPIALSVATDEKGRRHAYFEPAPAPRGRRRRLGIEQGIAVSGLQHLTLEAQQLEKRLRVAVHHARSQGVSWALVGFSVGLTENGARGRFGEPGQVLPGDVLDPGL